MPAVVLPVLDEAEAIAEVLGAMPKDFHPIVVDNGSTDGSARIAAELGAEVVNEPRRGFGSACYTGLLAAREEVVCFMDCDRSLDPADLQRVVAALGDAPSLVVGSRQAERGAWPLHARLANRMLALELRRRTGLTLSDMGPMRAAYREPLLKLRLTDRRSGWPLEMVLRANVANWNIVEIPVPYRQRAGRSKVTGTWRGTINAISDMSTHLRRIG